jgi:hypothetical protein
MKAGLQGKVMRIAYLLVSLVLLGPMAGCFGGDLSNAINDDTEGMYPSIWQRQDLDWNWTDSYSYVLEPGPHYALEVQEATFEVDTSQVWETGPSTSNIHLSYWLPSNTEIGDQVPVIAVISPYFSFGQQVRSNQRGRCWAGRIYLR